MKLYKLFFCMISAGLLMNASCGDDPATQEDPNKGKETSVKKVDACTLTDASELSAIFKTELKQLGETTWLESENDFYHYVALCGYTNSDLMITIRLAQRKTFINPAKSRDNSHEIQKEDVESIILVESMDINGVPALYYEEYDDDIKFAMPVLILYTEQFEASLIGSATGMKEELVESAGKVADALKKI